MLANEIRRLKKQREKWVKMLKNPKVGDKVFRRFWSSGIRCTYMAKLNVFYVGLGVVGFTVWHKKKTTTHIYMLDDWIRRGICSINDGCTFERKESKVSDD